MSERGVRGVRTVGGFRASRQARDLEDQTQWGDSPTDTHEGPANGPAVTTGVGVSTGTEPRTDTTADARTEPYVVVPEGVDRGRRQATGIPRWLVGVLAVMAGTGIALAALFGIWWNGLRVQAANRSAAQGTAQNFLIALTNFDSRTVNADFRGITSYATGDFAKQAQQFFGPQIRQQLEANQAQSRGEISSIYVQSAANTTASVYAVVDQTILNRNFNAPQADELRIVLSMNKTGGGWRVGNVTVLQAPTTNTGGSSTPTPAQPSR
jgi:Mce-associated membrane protein